jgi:two-component system chemotaxis response regulator CheY
VKVLIVEDNPDTRDFLSFFLASEGHQVIEAEDGEEGLHKALKEKPPLILTDISMPRMNGIDLIHHLREQPEFEQVKIIAFTAYGSDKAHDAKRAGADAIIHKPAPPNSITELIQQLAY